MPVGDGGRQRAPVDGIAASRINVEFFDLYQMFDEILSTFFGRRHEGRLATPRRSRFVRNLSNNLFEIVVSDPLRFDQVTKFSDFNAFAVHLKDKNIFGQIVIFSQNVLLAKPSFLPNCSFRAEYFFLAKLFI